MSKLKPEEKFPLLFYFVDGPTECSRTNKRLYFEKGRWHGINSGAAAIITEWPNQLSGCWVTVLLTSLLIFLMMLLMISSMTVNHSRFPRCSPGDEKNAPFDAKTIHLVHPPGAWDQSELQLLDAIIHNFPKFKFNLILINEIETITSTDTPTTISTKEQSVENETESVMSNEIFKKRLLLRRERNTVDKKMEDFRLSVQMGAKRLLDILLNNRRNINMTSTTPTTKTAVYTLEDILGKHPQVKIRRTTFGKIFSKSPLERTWVNLNDKLKLFAVRVLQLWQYGGVTFDLENSKMYLNLTEIVIGQTTELENRIQVNGTTESPVIKSYIQQSLQNYEIIPQGSVVTDDGGLHMETKSQCHAFFEEVLLNLRRIHWKEASVKYVIKKSLRIFCMHSMADAEYCKSIRY